MNIVGGKVILRAMEPEDMECFRDMINDPEVSKMVVGWSFPVSKEEQETWYERSIHSVDKRFTITMTDNDKAIGMATLINIDWVNRSASLGIKLHPLCPKRQGIASDAARALLRYAFDELNLNRLDVSWMTHNEASKGLWIKLGWKEEGIKRQAVYRDGMYRDLAYAGLLKEEYLEHNNEYA